MGKHEVGTPKYIANKIKSKGLQKLRWYCQMCQKQCRDENGFKCHAMSESHQRQLLLFAETPHTFLDSFSQDFKDGFLDLVRRMYGTKRVHANQVYQEYIRDKEHIHMNATKWLTLTEFVKWLGREGICTVDETEKGWFITWIDRDPETIARQEAVQKKRKMDMDDAERMARFIEKQRERDLGERGGGEEEKSGTELKPLIREEEEKVVLLLDKKEITKSTKLLPKANPFTSSSKSATSAESRPSSSKSTAGEKRKMSALEEIMQQEAKAKSMRKSEDNKSDVKKKDYWLTTGIVVKVVAKKLGEKYYKKKGVVQEVFDRYGAMVKMNESGDLVKCDQVHLETVIPNIGRKVKILNGRHRGEEATLVKIQEDKFAAKLRLDSGLVLDSIPYEDFSKMDGL